MASSSLSNNKQGTEGDKSVGSDENSLQKHVAFFDRNGDGLIYPWETYQGFRALGRGIFRSALAALLINLITSRKTRPGKGFSILFPIDIKNIHLAKHGSDTGAYDTQGRFVAAKFEEIFSKYAKTRPEAVTFEELKAMLKANKEPKDYFGWANAYFDWKTLHDICKENDGFLRKDTVRELYEATLFQRVEKERSSSSDQKKNA